MLVALPIAMGIAAEPPAPAEAPPDASRRDPLAVELERRHAEDIRPLLARSCFECHGEDKRRGGVRLDRLDTIDDAMDLAETLAIARELVTSRQMPPDTRDGLTDHEILTIQQWIDAALAYVPPDGAIDPGWYTIHRLNRAEYRATMRDLLGIDPARHDLAEQLPPDDTGYGFDNIAAVLAVSPAHMEAYLTAAERALEIALGPRFTVSGTPRPLRPLRLTTGGHPLDDGGFMLYSNGAVTGIADIPVTGEYEITITSWGTRGGDDLPAMSVRIGKQELTTIAVAAERPHVQTDRVRARIQRGRPTISAHFTNDYYVKDVADRNLAVVAIEIAGPLDAATVELPPAHARVLFAQPHAPTDAAEEAAARLILERFASRAFRRPATAGEVDRLVDLYREGRNAGDDHEQGVRLALSAVLVSPQFLYRTIDNPAPDDPGQTYTLGAYELASRLSYFLWSSMPDDELLALAATGELLRDDVLRAQTRRLLADDRAAAFIEGFAGQWLLLRNLDILDIDRARFPDYSPALKDAMVAEATMFFADVVRADRPALTLLDADHTFVNQPLAALYGLPGVSGEQMRRITLPPGSPRGGVLTMGAVLTVTSNPTRTSPVKRGLYVLDQILGTPPPPPPPDIPPLEQAEVKHHDDLVGPPAPPSLREQLKAHLFDPACASCHSRMDPLGLALENFSAIGAWRDADESGRIDASGTLPGGEAFSGPDELKSLLLARGGQFVENLTRKLLTYALGRGLEPFDRPTVTAITSAAAEREHRISALIEHIVLSQAFRTCRGVEP